MLMNLGKIFSIVCSCKFLCKPSQSGYKHKKNVNTLLYISFMHVGTVDGCTIYTL